MPQQPWSLATPLLPGAAQSVCWLLTGPLGKGEDRGGQRRWCAIDGAMVVACVLHAAARKGEEAAKMCYRLCGIEGKTSSKSVGTRKKKSNKAELCKLLFHNDVKIGPLYVGKNQGGTGKDGRQPKARTTSTGVRWGFEELQGLFPCPSMEVRKITDDEVLTPMRKRAFGFIDD